MEEGGAEKAGQAAAAAPLSGEGLGSRAATADMATSADANADTKARTLREWDIEPRPLGFKEVPWHADFGDWNAHINALDTELGPNEYPRPAEFAQVVLDETRRSGWPLGGTTAIGRTAKGWRRTGTKDLGKDLYAPVEQYAIHKADPWFARVSYHDEEPPVRFRDLDFVLRKNHSYHEAQYTPEIIEVNTVLNYEAELKDVDVEGWSDVSMEIVEMFHKLPAPLKKRVFTVLVISAIRTDLAPQGVLHDGDTIFAESVDVQLPIDLSSFPASIKTLSHADPKKFVQGVYASVEKVAQVSKDHTGNDTGPPAVQTRWSMATSSNAKGVLPMWIQNHAVPDAIAKDVKFVTDYLRENYGKEGWPEGPALDKADAGK